MYIKVLGHELGFVTLDDLRQLATAVDKTMIRDMFLKVREWYQKVSKRRGVYILLID